MKHQCVVVLDMGGQINQLVARRIRELNVYCQVMPYNTDIAEIKELQPIGIVITGGSGDIYSPERPRLDKGILELGVPILGIDFGARLLASFTGAEFAGEVKQINSVKEISFSKSALVSEKTQENYISQQQKVSKLGEGFMPTATANDEIIMAENTDKNYYCAFFKPEVSDSQSGKELFSSFLLDTCGAKQDWSMKDFADKYIKKVKEQVGRGKVLLALSGGVDSSVVASLLEKAIGNQLYCIFVDHGLMRLNEGDEVEAAFGNSGMNFIRVNAEGRFLTALKGVTDPEEKRKIIGEEFIRVFEEEAGKIGKVDYLAQGTIYPDVIESQTADGSVIKSHHNVGGLPEHVDFKDIIEPLRLLFKDEVRLLGEELGIPSYLVWRQPFPGPGLGIRVIGEITKEKLDTLRQADYIYRQELAEAGLDRDINQYFAVLTNMRSVGVVDDVRSYDYTVALRGVVTTDFMTAKWAKIPYDVLEKISTRITSEVSMVNRVVYDISSKPPATIEWE